MMNPKLSQLLKVNSWDDWVPKNQRTAENLLRLVMAESPDDAPAMMEQMKKHGLTIPDDIAPARTWSDFK